MEDIIENKGFEIKNLFCFEGFLTDKEFQEKIIEMNKEMQKNNSEITDHFVFSMDEYHIEDGIEKIKFGIYFPVNKKFQAPEDYGFKECLKVENAVMLRHTGNPNVINNRIDEIMMYIQEKGYHRNTPIYIVTVKDVKSTLDIEDMITEIYVGV